MEPRMPFLPADLRHGPARASKPTFELWLSGKGDQCQSLRPLGLLMKFGPLSLLLSAPRTG